MDPAIIITVMIFGGVSAAAIATFKNRHLGGWFAFGMLFPVIAVICALLMPSLPLTRCDG